jgi:hypothetical protein
MAVATTASSCACVQTVAFGGQTIPTIVGKAVRLYQFDLQVVGADLAGRQCGNGMLGHGLDSFAVGF